MPERNGNGISVGIVLKYVLGFTGGVLVLVVGYFLSEWSKVQDRAGTSATSVQHISDLLAGEMEVRSTADDSIRSHLAVVAAGDEKIRADIEAITAAQKSADARLSSYETLVHQTLTAAQANGTKIDTLASDVKKAIKEARRP